MGRCYVPDEALPSPVAVAVWVVLPWGGAGPCGSRRRTGANDAKAAHAQRAVVQQLIVVLNLTEPRMRLTRLQGAARRRGECHDLEREFLLHKSGGGGFVVDDLDRARGRPYLAGLCSRLSVRAPPTETVGHATRRTRENIVVRQSESSPLVSR